MSFQTWLSIGVIVISVLMMLLVLFLSVFSKRIRSIRKPMVNSFLFIPAFYLFMTWVFVPFIQWLFSD